MQTTAPDHPAIRQAERDGMPEAEVIGRCEQCGDELDNGHAYCFYEDMFFCDEICFAKHMRDVGELVRVG